MRNAFLTVRNSWRQLRDNPELAQLPRWRQLAEMLALYFGRRIGPGYYMQARWWRPTVPFADKWQHMNRYEYRTFIDRYNGPAYQKASQHKLLEKAVLSLLKIPTAPMIGFVHPVRGRSVEGAPLCSASDLARELAAYVGSRICCKQVEGWGGQGFAAFDVIREDDQLMLVSPASKALLTLEQWWQQFARAPDGVILEQHLTQHPVLAALNGSSLNTLRIWVYEKAGQFVVPGAYLRVGRAGSQVDNISGGGLCCGVDVSRGITSYAMTGDDCTALTVHPDSGAGLIGIAIPYWPACVKLAGVALAAFPHIRVAGLDMAVTVDGPCIIELNVCADYLGCAWMDLPLRNIDKAMR